MTGSATNVPPLRWQTMRMRTAKFAAVNRSPPVIKNTADEVISEQDQRVISQVVDAGRALVIAINKWDTLDEDQERNG